MSYEEIAKACEALSYRDKFRLAQLLLQIGRKQEEEEYPAPRQSSVGPDGQDQTSYVAERLLKLRPTKLSALSNSIAAMFQFQGGISETDKDAIISKLKKQKIIAVSDAGRVSYPE